MITGINESRTLTKQISSKCNCKFYGRKRNLNQKQNNDKCWCECKDLKELRVREKGYFWNPAMCSCKNGKHARSIGGSVVIFDEIIKETKTIPTKSTSTNFYILLAFLLITLHY